MSTDDTPSRATRRKTRIPAELWGPWQARLNARNETGSYVLLDIMRAGKRAVDAGIPLPPDEPRTELEVDLKWPQARAQYAEWAADFEAAGSSVRAVITAGVRSYVEDPHEFRQADWTPFPPPGGRK